MSGGSSLQIPQGISYSPGPNTPNGAAGSGPAFRILHSLLTFGPNKDGNQTKSFTSTLRSPFQVLALLRSLWLERGTVRCPYQMML